METVNIHQAKTQLSQLLHGVEQGEEVVIARAGVPIARLVAWKVPAQPAAELETDGEHRDPFDRLLVCQSRTEPMLLLTADRQLRRYGTTVNLVG